MLTYSFSAIAHLQKAPITANSENVLDSRCSAYGQKYCMKLSYETRHFVSTCFIISIRRATNLNTYIRILASR